MTISVRLNDKDSELIRNYAKINNISVSELVRESILEKIEDEYDLKAYKKAYEEYNKDKKTYTLSEIKKELNLEWNTKCFLLARIKNN